MSRHLFVAAAATLTVAGCAHHKSSPAAHYASPYQPASGVTTPNERSSDAITQARCEQEARCGNVGSGKSWSSMAQCRQFMQNGTYAPMSGTDCSAGIDKKQLGTCLDKIQNERCGSQDDALSRMAECAPSKVCKNFRHNF